MSGDLGHGHVRPRPDGVKARCGGPGLCAACAREAAAVSADRPAPPAPDTVTDDVVEAFRTGLYVHFCEGCEHGTAGVAWAECCLRAGLEAVVPLIRAQVAAEPILTGCLPKTVDGDCGYRHGWVDFRGLAHACRLPLGHDGSHLCRCPGIESYTWPAEETDRG